MDQKKGNVRKILLVADKPGWAFHHRAKDMMNLPTKNLQFNLKFRNQVTREDRDQYDLIYATSVAMARILHSKGIPLDKLAAGITSMRQFSRYINKDNTFNLSFIHFFKSLRAVNTASDEFVQKFSSIRPIYKTRVGIDANLFTPPNDLIQNSTFTAGWVGVNIKDQIKGYNFVMSAIKGLDIKLDIRTKQHNFVPREKMIEFYQGLDCYICSSNSEHIPLPVLEAAACGVPIISTNVGIVPELIKSYENGIIVKRNASAIQEAIQFLMNHPDLRKKMGQSIRKSILQEWTWAVCWKAWEEFFLTI